MEPLPVFKHVVTGFHVIPESHAITYQTEILEDTREQFAKDSAAP